MMHLKLSILFIFCGLLIVNGKKKNQTMWYTKIQVEHNPFYMHNFVAKLNANRLSWNLDAHLSRNLTDELWLQVLLSSCQQSTSSYRNHLKYDVNVYDLLRRGMNDKFNLLFVGIKNFWKKGDLPMEVPFLQGIYHWDDIRSDSRMIPAYMFQGTYRFDVITYFKLKNSDKQRDMLMNMTLNFKIRPN